MGEDIANLHAAYNAKMQEAVTQMGEYMHIVSDAYDALVTAYISLEKAFAMEIVWPDRWDGHPVHIAKETHQAHKKHLQAVGFEVLQHIKTHEAEVSNAVLVMNQINEYLHILHDKDVQSATEREKFLQKTKLFYDTQLKQWFFNQPSQQDTSQAMEVDQENEEQRLQELIETIQKFQNRKQQATQKLIEEKQEITKDIRENRRDNEASYIKQILTIPKYDDWVQNLLQNNKKLIKTELEQPETKLKLIKQYCIDYAPKILPTIEYKQPTTLEEATYTVYQFMNFLAENERKISTSLVPATNSTTPSITPSTVITPEKDIEKKLSVLYRNIIIPFAKVAKQKR